MLICIGIPKHAEHWRLPLVQVRNFYWLLEFSLSRERHNFYYADRSIWPNKRAEHPVAPLTRLASSSFKSQLASPRDKSQLTAFFQNHQEPQPIASGHDVIRTPVSFSLWGFYYDICNCHIVRARVWTPALNVWTCTCTKPNSSKPN